MKKLFICVMTSLCSTFAFADADLVVKPAVIYGGSGTMEVVINKGGQTAFQFDAKLPTGISVSAFGTESGNRKFEKALVDASTNTWRFLTYDEENAAFDAGTTFNVTLAAAANAEEGEAETEAIILVDPNGNSTDVENGSSAVSLGASIAIGSTGMTTYVCNSGLDFTDREEEAYVVTGIVGKNVLMTRVKKVPAGTPIVVKGTAGTHNIPGAKVTGLYYKNLLIGNNTDASINVTPEGSDQFLRFTTSGFQTFSDTKSVGAHKAYVRAKALPEAKAGADWSPLKIGDGKRTSLCADVDLDFSDQTAIKPYIAMGYNNGNVVITSIKKVPAGTPVYVLGPKGEYTIKSSAAQAVYENMMVGNNSDASITINPTDGEYTNLYVATTGFSTFKEARSVGAHKSYLQILTSYLPASSRGISDGSIVCGETEAETLIIPILGSIEGNNDNTTSIRTFDEVQSDDVWYNLSGQRIDTPSKKGLYIKNGKKVVVK